MTDDNVHSIQAGSLNAKRQALNLLAQHDADSLTEAVKLLADPAPDSVLAEALKPLVQYAEKEDLDAAIAMLAGDDNLAEDHIVELREALERLARHATGRHTGLRRNPRTIGRSDKCLHGG